VLQIHPKKRRLGFGAKIGFGMVFVFVFAAIFADTLAPYDYAEQTRNEPSAPRSSIRMVDKSGAFHLRPFIYRTEVEDPLSGRYREITDQVYPIGFLVKGYRYRLLGLFDTNLHLLGTSSSESDTPRLRLLGTDALGRDIFSRMLQAIRFSLSVCVLGGLAACFLGILIGIISGYSGKLIDTCLMGITDGMLSLPTLIIILAARAAFPLELPPLSAALLLVSIFALVGWAGMARLTRGLVLATRDKEFVIAAKATGVSGIRILQRHILPNISRPLIIQAALLLPAFLIAETALSFLGVGLQEPEPSLGNMLSSATDITLLRSRPLELLSPAIAIFLFILGVRLVANENDRSV
jgi:peptide/nickel transport system permease protein